MSAPSAATAAISGGSGSGNANLSIVTSGGSGGPVGGGLKEGSPAASAVSPAASAGFHGGKQPFRGQGTRGGGRGEFFKFIYSEKATKFCEIFPLILSTVHTDKSKGKILQNFVAFSE